MFDVFKNRLELIGTLTTVTALRISQGRSLEPIGADLPVVKDALGRPLIPGSSFKGAMRSRLESFLRGIVGTDATAGSTPMRKLVANPAVEDEWALTRDEVKILKGMTFDEMIRFCWAKSSEEEAQSSEGQEEPFPKLPFERLCELIQLKSKLEGQNPPENPQGQLAFPEDFVHINKLPDSEAVKALEEGYVSEDDALSKAMLIETDIVSKLFGSPWIASKFHVRDLTVDPNNWFNQYQERDGVAIDRDTETASDGKLYSFQVVPAGTPFKFRAIVENVESWELGLLMIGLHQFETQQIPLGGGRSRGLGVVELSIEDQFWFDVNDPPDELKTLDDCPKTPEACMLAYLRDSVSSSSSLYPTDSQRFGELKTRWTNSLIQKLQAQRAFTEQVNTSA